jgi:CDP-diacylglycerol--glycerol-3-phosphate 3-phosphatidyltransferase
LHARPSPEGARGLKRRLRDLSGRLLGPPARALTAAGVQPDHATWLGLALSVAAGVALFEGAFRLGAVLATASGLCDMLDGQLARAGRGMSRFGAFLDSTLDRLADAALLTGLAGYYATRAPAGAAGSFDGDLVALFAVLALLGSLLVSYTRARAEGLGLDCRVGWFERPERLVLLIAAAAFGPGPVMPWALLILTLLSFATTAQRVTHVYRHTRGARRDDDASPDGF